MTTIIGMQFDWGCEIAADGRTTSDGRPFNGHYMNKVTARGEYLLAAAGAGGACDWVTRAWKPPAFKGGDTYEFITTVFTPSLFSSLTGKGFHPFKDDDSSMVLIVAVNGDVYQIESDGTVMFDVNGIYGIGTGAAYAIGAIEAGAYIEEALHIAARYDIYTGEPFITYRQVRP